MQTRKGISEADLAAAWAAGAKVKRVVVVEVPPVSGMVPHLLLSDRAGWHPIAMCRYEGIRLWREFKTLRRVLAGHGYTGALLFRNAGTGAYNMVYRRSDGTIGWVEPNRGA